MTRESDDATGDVALIATPVKALADYVYVYRKEWLTPDPADDLNETMESYRNKRVLRFLAGLRREYGL